MLLSPELLKRLKTQLATIPFYLLYVLDIFQFLVQFKLHLPHFLLISHVI